MTFTFEKLAATLKERKPKKLNIPGFAPSAVLVPIIERSGFLSIAFMERSDEAPTHSGHISFPGGQRKPGEKALDTALREAEEELGILTRSVRALGELDDVATPLGFVVTPVAGWLTDPPLFQADAREVKSFFEVSLEDLAEPKNFVYRGEHNIGERAYPLPEFHVEEKNIWGATARMVQELLEIWKAG
jgi:8-oxo-dGTP pyrophosphatase MutT (NUDIX family)